MSGESNGIWGDLAAHDDEMAEAWDRLVRLPEPGQNPILDAFCKSKHITIPDLVRQGARLSSTGVIAFGYDQGIKYRSMVDGKRWNYIGSTFPRMKIVRADPASDTLIICEGETDGAWLSARYPCDIGILPAGAMTFPSGYAAQAANYTRLLVGLDNDQAGQAGWSKIVSALPHAQRFAPPEGVKDWCSIEEAVPLPDPAEAPPRMDVVVWGKDLLTLEVPEVASWYEQAVLPIGGQLIIHGWAKSLKTFLGLDLLSQLAQGNAWMGFEPTEEPCRVCAIQFEIPWAFYRERVSALRQAAVNPELWDENFGTFSPMVRPRFTAGQTADEDRIIKALVEANVQVVMFDPIRRAVGTADMNAENEVRSILRFFERIQNEGITVIATHHDNKDGARSKGGSPVNMTGSGAFAGDADSICSIWLPKGSSEQDARRNINFILRNGPAPAARGFELINGVPVVNPHPYGEEESDPAPREGEPEI